MSDSDAPIESRSGTVEPAFLSLEEVATYLNVSSAQVYALVRSGELPAMKIGGRGIWRIGRRELDEYVKRMHEETSAALRNHAGRPSSRG